MSTLPGGLAAYRAMAQGGPAAASPTATPAAPGSGSFSAMLEQALDSTVQSARAADTASVQALTGQAGVTDVVLAVSRAELALQTTVALRDRVVSAYQEIMRMPI